MPHISMNGTDIFYELKSDAGNDSSSTEVVAFLNGVAMSTESWILQTSFFNNRYRVLLHDFRGQGKSGFTGEVNFEQHAEDLKELLDYLQIEEIHLVGVSYGAEVGMYFALMFPERVKTLTLGTATSESDPLLKSMVHSWIEAAKTFDGQLLFKVMTPLVYANPFLAERGEWLERRGRVFAKIATQQWFEGFMALCANFLTLNITDRLTELKVPTLVVSGEEDLLKPLKYSHMLHRQIAGAKLAVVKDAGHAVYLEKPEEFNATVLHFIQNPKQN